MKVSINDKKNEPWWVIAVKVIVYAAGLILAGYGTANAATAMGIF